jgi:hypothetical protein
MLDKVQEAQQLCAMHGYECARQGSEPVVMLVKVRGRSKKDRIAGSRMHTDAAKATARWRFACIIQLLDSLNSTVSAVLYCLYCLVGCRGRMWTRHHLCRASAAL